MSQIVNNYNNTIFLPRGFYIDWNPKTMFTLTIEEKAQHHQPQFLSVDPTIGSYPLAGYSMDDSVPPPSYLSPQYQHQTQAQSLSQPLAIPVLPHHQLVELENI